MTAQINSTHVQQENQQRVAKGKHTLRIVLQPLPEPPDMAQRLAKIYALALQRYHEHQNSTHAENFADPADLRTNGSQITGGTDRMDGESERERW